MKHCLTELKRYRIRPTLLRTQLLEHLHAARAPLSAPELLDRFAKAKQSINKTTVYRDLELLVKIGLLHRVRINDGRQYYELSEREHHHHLICKECEQIYDLEIHEEGLLKKVNLLANQLRFTVEEHAIEFYGVCRGCQLLKI